MNSRWNWVALGLVLALVVPAAADEAKPPQSHKVPYRLTVPKHILVRAKINGKGPFNFILDTGAPALFVSTKVCDKLGIKPDGKGWGTFERFEIEGGVVLPKARGRIEDPFQLEGMNGLGLAGAELHGIIGYNILAQYRMEIDFTESKMVWTRLEWEPKAPLGLGGKGGSQGGLELVGSMMKVLGAFMGKKANPDVITRGFLGMEVTEDRKSGVLILAVMEGSPAARAGLKAGDRLEKWEDKTIYDRDDLKRYAHKIGPGKTVKLQYKRGDEAKSTTLQTGEGL